MSPLEKAIRIAAAAGAAAWLAVCGAPARAQQATTDAPAGAAAFKAAPAEAARLVTDVFMGQGVVGPYVLSWSHVEPGSVVVTRDGGRLQRDVDYRLDVANGVVTFSVPLRAQQIARVDYGVVTGKARANAVRAVPPMQFRLFEAGRGALDLQALYQPRSLAPGTRSTGDALGGTMLLSFAGAARLDRQSSLTSRLYVDGRGGNLVDRSALQVAETSKTRYGQLNLSFAQAGAEFSAGEQTGIDAGRRVVAAGASLKPIHGFTASASFQQAAELLPDGGAEGATVTTFGQKLSGAIGQRGRLQAAHTNTVTRADDGDAVTRTTDRVQVDQAIGDRTNATAMVERTETNAGDTGSVTQTSKVTVTSQPTDKVTVQGTVRNTLLPSGPQDAATLRVDAAATDRITLGTEIGETYTRAGAVHRRQASVNYRPGSRLTLDGGVLLRADSDGEALAGSLGAVARPARYLELKGRYTGRREAANGIVSPDALQTVSVQAAFNLPRTGLKVTGAFAENPENETGAAESVRSRSVGLQSSLGRIELSGAYTQREDRLAVRSDAALDVKVGWRMRGGTVLTTGYREALTLDNSALSTDTFTLSFAHRVGSTLDLILSSSLTRRTQDGVLQPNEELKAEAKVGVRF